MRPVFISENVEISTTPRIVGNNHLLVSLKQRGSDKVFDCIGFNMGEFCNMINKRGIPFDVVYTIDKSTRDGRTFPQFRLKDIKIKENNEELN